MKKGGKMKMPQMVIASLLLLAPCRGFAQQTLEQAAGNQERALSQAVEQVKTLQEEGRPIADARFGLQIEQNALYNGIIDSKERLFGSFAHPLTPGLGIEISFVDHKIIGIQKSGPADQAGVRLGDVIVQVNGQDAKSVFDIKELASKFNPVTLTVTRDGEANSLSCSVEKKLPVFPKGFLDKYNDRFGACCINPC